MHDFRRLWIVGIHAVQSEIRPYWCEATEGFASREAVPALHPFSFRGGQQEGHIVPGLGMSGGEYLPVDGAPEHPLKRGVTRTLQVGCHTRPVQGAC